MGSGITAEACANIAFIKYWGNRPGGSNLPLNPSISMTLAACVTRTTLALLPEAGADEIVLGRQTPDEKSRSRITGFLDVVRRMAGRTERAEEPWTTLPY